MATPDELVASGRGVEEVRAHIGATSLAYLSLDGMQAAIAQSARRFCRACLTGRYPTPVPDGGALGKLRFEPAPA
jgi:amidophosphoribosyltransferase